jgi:hypothetical protein
MLPELSILAVLLLGAIIWLVLYLVLLGSGRGSALDRRERRELDALRALVDDLKETAWDHRELDSPLSTIVIDKIREHERRRRELG